MKKNILHIIFISIFIILFFNCNNNIKEYRDELDKESYVGIVVSKEKLKVTCIKIKHLGSNEEKGYCLLTPECIENTEVGDTIHKFYNRNFCLIKNQEKNKSLFIKYHPD